MKTLSKTGMVLAAILLLAGLFAGMAWQREARALEIRTVAVCGQCRGSGKGAFTCQFCKGTGSNNGFRCNFCNGSGFPKCTGCNGTGQR